MCGPLTDHMNLVPRCRGAQSYPSPNSEVFNQESAREVGGVSNISGTIGSSRQGTSPARHSLPCPEPCLRDQPARGRTTGEPVPPGGFGRAERTR